MSDPEEQEYEVEEILNSKVVKDDNGKFVTCFDVKWKGWEKVTPVPFANVSHLPLLMKHFTAQSKKKLVREMTGSVSLSQEVINGVPNFPKIPKEMITKMNDKKSDMPNGNEIVENIHKKEYEKGVMYYLVQFVGSPYFYKIRDCIFQYYYPEAACYFEFNEELAKEKEKRLMNGNGLTKREGKKGD